MNRNLGRFIIAGLILPFLVLSAFGHAMHLQPLEGGHGIRAVFDDGLPAAFAEVRVWAPGLEDEPYQEGWTDADGCFVFYPQTAGVWRIEIDDGMGHAARHRVDVSPAGIRHIDSVSRSMPRLQGLITGVSIIFGLFGLFALLRNRPPRKGTL